MNFKYTTVLGKIEIKNVCKLSQLLPVRILCSGTFAKLQGELLASPCLSVCPSVLMQQLGSHWRFYIKLDIWVFFENLSRKFKNKWHFTLRPIYILIICLSILLRKKNVPDNSCRENQNTHFMFSTVFSNIVAFMRKRGKKYCRAGQATWQCGARALHAR